MGTGVRRRAPSVRVLGSLELGPPSRPSAPQGKLCRLLAILIANANKTVSVDLLCEAVWGDARPATYENGLRGHLTRVRRALREGGSTISLDAKPYGDEAGYCLTIDADDVDHIRFRRLVAGSGSASTRVADLEEALRLWRGSPFLGIDIMELQPIVLELAECWLALNDQLARHYLDDRRPEEAIGLLRPIHADHPDRESTCALLARALYAAGRQRDALKVSAATTTALLDAGLSPSKAVSDVEQLILRHDPDVTDAGAVEWRTVPDALLRYCTGPFVGRDENLEELNELIGSVHDHGVSVLISGDAGMGKTRLLAEAARLATHADVRCFHASADPVSPGPFHFGLHLLGRLAAEQAPPVAESARAAIAAIESHRTTAAPTEAQRVLLDRLDELVQTISAHPTPIMLFLDDAQWIDSASLGIVRHLVRSGGHNLGVVLAARRGDHGPSWDDFIAQLPSSPVQTINVGPLGTDEIAEWMTALGLDVGVATATIAATVLRETKGVAFVVAGVLQDLATMTDPIDALERLRDGLVPEGLYDPLRARIGRLDERHAKILAVAAVVSVHLTPRETAAICRSLFGPGAWTIDERRCFGLVRPDTTRPGDFVFEHSITRAVLQDLLSHDEQQFVHRAAALAAGSDAPTAADAFHLVEAIPLVEPSVALAAVAAAAADALEMFAFEEAAVLLRKAIAIHRRFPQPDSAIVVLDLNTELARAMQYLGGRESAIALLTSTIQDAAELEQWDRVTACALAAADFGEVLDPDDPVRRLLFAGIDLLPLDHPGRRPLAVEAIIKSTIVEGATDDVRALYDEELASIPDDDPAASQRRRAWLHMSSGSPNAEERLHEATILRGSSPDRTGRDWLDATLFLISAQLERGRTTRATQLHRAYHQAANRSGRPGVKWLSAVAAADLAQLNGRIDHARELADAALGYGTDHAVPDAVRSHAGHVLITSLLTGELAPELTTTSPSALRATKSPVLSAAAGLLLALEARRSDAASAASDAAWLLRRAPISTLTPFAIALCAETWLLAGRPAELQEQLLPLVRPYSGTMWRMALVGTSLGPVDRHLGALESHGSASPDAAGLLPKAVDLARRAGAPVWELAGMVELVRYRPDRASRHALRVMSRQPLVARARAVVHQAERVLADSSTP